MKKLLLMFCITAQLFAHGVGFDLKKSDDVQLIYFYYSDGKVMSYSEIQIYGPTDSDVEYQNGRTDRNGYFAFYPNAPGVWLVTATDEKGHSASAQILMKKIGDGLKGYVLK